MGRGKILLVVIINLIISLGYFFYNQDSSIVEVSSDLSNIIPVCKKIDNPELYKNDLFLDNLDNVRYYTPFYVHTLRFFAKITNYDYLKALNYLSLFTHLFYGLFWFFLLYTLRKNYWLALTFSIFVRGVVWPPGGELLGISDLWTIMPRTLYSALMPLPFLIYVYLKKYSLPIAAFSLGLIFNFHPISGIGGIIIYISFFVLYYFYTDKVFLKKTILKVFLFCFIGMIPFLFVYFTNVKTGYNNIELFEKAFHKRIPEFFFDPILFLKQWNRPVFYFYFSLFFLFYWFDSSRSKISFKIILLVVLTLFITANGSVYIETFINNVLNKNIRMSFQLIRFQKFILVMFQISFYLLIVEFLKKINVKQSVTVVSFLAFILILSISNHKFFNKIPFIGDDMFRTILPKSLSFVYVQREKQDLATLVKYIEKNTPKNAVFYGSDTHFIRAGATRAVVLDKKGASMLIEGNVGELVRWYQENKLLSELEGKDRTNFLKSKNVTYVVSEQKWNHLELVKQFNSYYLYKVD